MLENSSSCIDLVFTSQPNMVIGAGVHSSLHPNSHHQIIFVKFDLKVYYPPPYERLIWHYKHANTGLIKRALESFNWKEAFSNNSIEKNISILNEIVITIMSNFIPNETRVFGDQDPPWMNNKIKDLIIVINECYKKHQRNNHNHYYTYKFKSLRRKLENLMETSKQRYYERLSQKLSSIITTSNC